MISLELFLQLAKIEGILWSISDVFLVFFVLKLIDAFRKHNKIEPYKKLYYLLFSSFAITPILLFVSTFSQFLFVEIILLDIQYFILIYICLKNYKLVRTTFLSDFFKECSNFIPKTSHKNSK